jgi:signal transduction histidine kinase
MVRQELVPEIGGHIEALTKAARRTMVFNVHLDHAMDTILSTTRWTLRVLGDLAAAETSKGALATTVDRLRAAVGLRPAGDAALLRQYVRHMDAVAAELDRAILEAQELLLLLEHMQIQLDDIHSLVRRDTGDTAAAYGALMTTSLWTWLGLRNRERVADVRQRLALLAQLGRHRKAAMQHVSRTLLRLAEIRTRLAELRERAGTRELEGDLTDMPLRLHMEVMQSGLQRLEASRRTAEKVKEDFLLHKRGGKQDPFA